MGVGWVSRRPLATWEVLARELGHSLGASDFLDETKCVQAAFRGGGGGGGVRVCVGFV